MHHKTYWGLFSDSDYILHIESFCVWQHEFEAIIIDHNQCAGWGYWAHYGEPYRRSFIKYNCRYLKNNNYTQLLRLETSLWVSTNYWALGAKRRVSRQRRRSAKNKHQRGKVEGCQKEHWGEEEGLECLSMKMVEKCPVAVVVIKREESLKCSVLALV